MPSGHSGGSGGGHSGGFSSHSGHFGVSRGGSSHGSGSSFGGSHASFGPRPIHRPWYRPRVVVFGGRQVYLGTGRASTVSVLGFLVVLALIVTAFLGFSWMDKADFLEEVKADYEFYHAMAQNAAIKGNDYQVDGEVYKIEYFNEKYRIRYNFDTPAGKVTGGWSMYVYDYATAKSLLEAGTVRLALETELTKAHQNTDSVPLDYKDTVLEDDEEYVDAIESIKLYRTGTFIMIGISGALILAAVLVPLTASKATAEQIAANNQNNNSDANGQNTTPAGTWRCDYCNTVNDNSKDRCDGCGAKRQK